MRAFKIFIAAFLLFTLERLFFARIEIFSLTPWLGFAFCMIGAAVSRDTQTAIIAAAVYGLISDLSGEGAAGSAMVVFALSAGAVQFVAGRIFGNSLVFSLAVVFVISIVGEMLYYLLNSQALDISLGSILWSIAIPLSVLNTIAALALYPVAKRLFAERRAI